MYKEICISMRTKERPLDLILLRRAGIGLLDHHLVEASVKICRGSRKRGNDKSKKRVVKV